MDSNQLSVDTLGLYGLQRSVKSKKLLQRCTVAHVLYTVLLRKIRRKDKGMEPFNARLNVCLSIALKRLSIILY